MDEEEGVMGAVGEEEKEGGRVTMLKEGEVKVATMEGEDKVEGKAMVEMARVAWEGGQRQGWMEGLRTSTTV